MAGTIIEKERKIPAVRQADVVVGGGSAGFGAAVVAARNSASTL